MRVIDLIKLGISIIWDLFDFIIGRIPVIGMLIDIIGGFLAMALWGN